MKAVISFVLLAGLVVCNVGWGQNLLADPGFERPGTWTAFGNANYEFWARRSGTNGFALYGWDSLAFGGCWQNVGVMGGPAVYTFAVYVRCESNFNPSVFDLKLTGYALDGVTKTEDDGVADWKQVPRDGFWHHLFVTKIYTNPATAYVRPVIYSAWNGSGIGDEGVMIDDAALYVGTYTGSPEILNTGFEIGNHGDWRGAYWAAYPETHWEIADWAHRSGTNGVDCFGWEPEAVGILRRLSQPVTLVPTGVYTFSAWLNREPNFKLNSAALKLEFFDITLTNKVQTDVVTNFVVPNDSWWWKYYVVGAVTSPAVYEMRPVLEINWDRTTNGGGRALRVDDLRFFQGTHDGYGVETEWGYYSAPGADPRLEQVPGTNVGPFLQVNYNTHTNIFYLLANSPDFAVHKTLGDKGEAGIRTAWQRPENNSWVETYTKGQKIGRIVLTNGQFRGQPSSGLATVDLWRVAVPHPTTTNGAFYTNRIYVFYAPYFKATNQNVDTELKFLVLRHGNRTNALGQIYFDHFFDRDYGMWLVTPMIQDAFTNGSFENPPIPPNTFDETGWVGLGNLSRESWAARSGSVGVSFHSWNPGSALLYQDVMTAGGAVEFSFWIQVQREVHPTLLEGRIEWYDSKGTLLRVNRQDISWVPHYNDWTKVVVLGECNDPDVTWVRYIIESMFDAGTGPLNDAIMIDDANVEDLRSSLENGNFEIGPKNAPKAWYIQPGGGDVGGLEPWAGRDGSTGFAFYGWSTNRGTYDIRVMQPIAVSQAGTYIFSIWAKAEQNFQFSNAALRLEWFDANYSNKVQSDTVQYVVLPLDQNWHMYAITGTCNQADLRFLQVSFEIQYGHGETGLPRQAAMLDDAALTYVASSSTDGIPNWWLQQYGLGLTNGVGAGDDDGDGFSNAEEYAADTNPTDSNSWFRGLQFAEVLGQLGYMGSFNSTNSRYYFLEYKTNLLDSAPWLRYGTELQGSASGTGVVFVTTNDAPQRFYRMGAKP